MSDEPVAPEARGVTVELLATVELGPEIEGMEGRQLRMRMVTIEPGGVFGPVHDHQGRPGTVYVLQGTITDHRNGIATDYGPGVGWPEDRNTVHWLENRRTEPDRDLGRHCQARVGGRGTRESGSELGGPPCAGVWPRAQRLAATNATSPVGSRLCIRPSAGSVCARYPAEQCAVFTAS
ncbi:MAG TPA: cupin domain-containing protein [Propionibacteriaceae bacterium]